MSSDFTEKEIPDVRIFGYFRCHVCRYNWKSARTFYNPNKKEFYTQKCKKCRSICELFQWEEIKCKLCSQVRGVCQCPKNIRGESRKPHRSSLCEKCQVDGIPCHLSSFVWGHEEPTINDEYDDESDDESEYQDEDDDQSDETDDWTTVSVPGQWTDKISSSKQTKTNLWLNWSWENKWTSDESDSDSDDENVDLEGDFETSEGTGDWSMDSMRGQWTSSTSLWGKYGKTNQWFDLQDRSIWSDEDTDDVAMFTSF